MFLVDKRSIPILQKKYKFSLRKFDAKTLNTLALSCPKLSKKG